MNVAQRPDEPANSALLRMGLLGCSPVQPTVAIHLTCLELYHQIRRRQSSFSIQSITKVLCALHNVSLYVSNNVLLNQCLGDIFSALTQSIFNRI